MRISDGSSDVCSSDLLSCADAFCRPFPPCAGSRLAKLPSFIATALGDLPIRAASDRTSQFDLWNCPKGHCKLGRASCRERVCQYGLISVVAVSLTKKPINTCPLPSSKHQTKQI